MLLTQAEYNVPLNDVASLAIVTFKIPDIGDAAKRAQLPPSQHKKHCRDNVPSGSDGFMFPGSKKRVNGISPPSKRNKHYRNHSPSMSIVFM